MEGSIEASLQTGVIAEADRIGVFDLTEVVIGDDGNDLTRGVFRCLDCVSDDQRLVVVANEVEMRGLGADVVDVSCEYADGALQVLPV